MSVKKLGIGAAFAGAGVLAARSLGPRLHEHCRSMCAEKCGGSPASAELSARGERKCSP